MAHKAHLPWSIKIKKEGITALYDSKARELQ